jgi:hypothetical protein
VRRRPIYVESFIRAPIDQIWDATQQPDQHQRWDARFGSITYLPRVEGEPQKFTYATRLVRGVTIGGTGESLGDRDRPDGSRWSGLKFWATDRRSILEAGAGYWRYVPTLDGVRFLTRFDYRPRWGAFGRVVDRWLFRPVFGWATAWSFDRLRIWLEDGVPPEQSRDRSIVHVAAVAALVGVWLYQGAVPKLWKVDAGEVANWTSLHLTPSAAQIAVRTSGVVEVLLGLAIMVRSSKRWPFVLTLVAIPAVLVGAAVVNASSFTRAFNPVALNLAVASLAVVALANHSGRPSGQRPLRRAPDQQPNVGDLP